MERLLLVPAAGLGSRLGGDVPKLLVPVNGRSMIRHLLDLYAPIAERAAIVVHPATRARVEAELAGEPMACDLFVQEQPTGMLDAVQLARPAVERWRPRRVLITWCDQIAIHPLTVERIAAATTATPAPSLAMPTCRSRDPYVHLERDRDGHIVGVLHRREGDVMPASGESDAGVFDLSREAYLDWLTEYAAAPAIGAQTRERNFVPFVAFCAARGHVVTVDCLEPEEAVGINTPDERARIEAHLRRRPASNV